MTVLDTEPTIPADVTSVDPDWLTGALRHGGLDADVIDVGITPIGAGEGFMSRLARITPTYKETVDGAPASLIVKIPPVDPGALQTIELSRMNEREARFYCEVAPKVDLRVPACFYAGGHPGTQDYVLVLEDLAPAHALDQVAGASPEQATSLLSYLAEFHATWWEHPSLPGLDWMPMVTDPQNAVIKMLFDMFYPAFCDRYRERLPERVFPWVEAFADQAVDWLAGFANDPLTICHGDFRLDNVLVEPDGTYAVVDWQLPMRAHCFGDVVYFLATNLEPEVRKAHDVRLLDHYVGELESHGVDVAHLDPDARLHRYRQGLLFFALSMSAGIADLDTANERGTRALDAIVTRIFTAADEHDAGLAI